MKKRIAMLFFAAFGLILFGCAGGESGSEDTPEVETAAPEAEATDDEEVITVIDGTDGDTALYAYIDENDELTGFDIETVRTVFDNLAQYDVEFEVAEFNTILGSLENNTIQMISNQISYNEDREEKFYFSVPYIENEYGLVVRSDETEIESFEDIGGFTSRAYPGSDFGMALEQYNEDNPDNPVDIVYSEENDTSAMQNVETGRYDFELTNRARAEMSIEKNGFDLKVIPLSASYFYDDEKEFYNYIIFSKTEEGEALRDAFNEELIKLIEDGTISELSKEYLGNDYVVDPETAKSFQ